MSTISDALKKAQKSPFKKPEQAKPKTKELRLLLAVSIIFGGLLGLYALEYRMPQMASAPQEEIISAEAYSPPAEDLTVIEQKLDIPKEKMDINEMVKLSGIMFTSENPLAVINDDTRRVGDKVGDFTIVEIGETFVRVSSGDEEYVVTLN